MPATGLAQPTVPYGADQTIYVVIDNSGAPGSVMSEVECPDLEAVVTHLMAGQFSDPMRVMAFNTLEHWSHDLSADVANEIQARCDCDTTCVPDHLRDFVGRHAKVRACVLA